MDTGKGSTKVIHLLSNIAYFAYAKTYIRYHKTIPTEMITTDL